MRRWKRITLLSMVTWAVVFALALIGNPYFGNVVIPALQVGRAELEPISREIGQHGVTGQLGDVLREAAVSHGWAGVFVTPEPAPRGDVWRVLIPAGYPVALVGHEAGEGLNYVPSDWRHILSSGPYAQVTGPDGVTFNIWIAQAFANPWPVMARVTRYAPGVALVLLWLSMAAFVYVDTRDRRAMSAPWVLLSLLAGPLALAVWLIYSRSPGTKGDAGICPGCGHDQVRGTAFCVHCGYALRPACPDCRRPVESEWVHCGACGSTLSE